MNRTSTSSAIIFTHSSLNYSTITVLKLVITSKKRVHQKQSLRLTYQENVEVQQTEYSSMKTLLLVPNDSLLSSNVSRPRKVTTQQTE